MARPTEEIRTRLQQNLIESCQARKSKNFDRCWTLLEDAHVLSQPWALLHVRVHGSMFGTAMLQRDVREVWGQLSRIAVAGPGSLSGRYPTGNTGRARVPATQPMPIAGELAEVLQRAGQRTD